MQSSALNDDDDCMPTQLYSRRLYTIVSPAQVLYLVLNLDIYSIRVNLRATQLTSHLHFDGV